MGSTICAVVRERDEVDAWIGPAIQSADVRQTGAKPGPEGPAASIDLEHCPLGVT